MTASLRQRLAGLGLATACAALGVVTTAPAATAASPLIGSGSSFAGIELQEWSKDVASPPYNLNVNYQSSSSGQGRQNFRDKVVDFAVTDIRYNKFDVNPPDPATFDYIPVTAGGVAFMYNLKAQGFGTTGKPLQLSSLTVCGIFTGAIPYWDDPAIAADNPGVTLPHVPVTPVVRADPAGTNFVLEEYCIQLHNDLYSRFAAAVSKATSTDYPDEPTSNWPILSPIVAAQGSEGAADSVAAVNNDGYITAVETGYATQRHFPVAAVKNDTGAYVTPTDAAVATALSFATQQPDGTHVLNFQPHSAAAYNPSTYSYMLVRLTGADAAKGAAITSFAEFCLTIGQSHASQLSYASIGRNLILYGLDRLKAVPGYVPPSADEIAAIPAVDTAPNKNPGTPPVTAPSSAPPTTARPGSPGSGAPGGAGAPGGGGAGTGGTGGSGGGTPTGGTTPKAGGGTTGSGGTPGSGLTGGTGGGSGSIRPIPAAGSSAGSAGSAGAGADATSAAADLTGAVDPSAALSPPTGPLGRTGVEADLVAAAGGALLAAGEIGRRRSRRRRGHRPRGTERS
jgi:ABC-type phosphate transport system substrate-binding protein